MQDKLVLTALFGGFLAVLTLIHFVIDWGFQSHNEAMVKHITPKIRAKHCFIYTLPFVVFLCWLQLPILQIGLSALILFLSHFFEDTYWPVFMWAKYIRKPEEMQWEIKSVFQKYGSKALRLCGPGYVRMQTLIFGLKERTWREDIMLRLDASNKRALVNAQEEMDRRGFLEFIDTAMGKILMITIDQLIHIVFLLPIAYMIVFH